MKLADLLKDYHGVAFNATRPHRRPPTTWLGKDRIPPSSTSGGKKFRQIGTQMGEQTEDRTIREHARAPLVSSTGAGTKPCLTIVAGGPVGTVYTLPGEKATLIGRGTDADLRFEDQRISRQHAKVITSLDGEAVIEDLGSSNGTFVNGARVQWQVLKDGDKIEIGSSAIVKFSYQDDIDRTFQRELSERGIKDELTDIYSERYFLDRIATEYAHARRHEGTLALLMFDIDDFGGITDPHGQPARDFLLKELTRVARQVLRAEDVFARYGSDAFVLLARDVGDDGAVVLAQRVRRITKNHEFILDGTKFPVTISVGIATLSDKAKKPAKLIRIAEQYLKKAKKAGGNSIGGRAVKEYVKRNGSSTTVRF